MTFTFGDIILCFIAGLLLVISVDVGRIVSRLRDRFPTEKEQDRDWAIKDPLGHWEAHKNDKKK